MTRAVKRRRRDPDASSPESRRHELEALLDAAVDAVIMIDRTGRIELVNAATLRIFGYEESELIDQQVNMLMTEPDRRLHDSYLERYLETGVPHIIGIGREVRARRKDGTVFDAELAVGRIPEVAPARFVGFIRDITVRKNAEEALRRSEAQLRSAQSLANLGNYVTDLTGAGEHYWSPQLQRILGRDPEAPFMTFAEYCAAFVHPSDRERVLEIYSALRAGFQEAFDIEYRIVRCDGAHRHLHHFAQAVRDPSGRVVRHVGTIHDITERRRAEDELRQTRERLTHFNRLSTMGEMAAGIAHEINQPLTAIATYAQASSRLAALEDLPRDDVLFALDQIAKQALRAGEIIRRLRAFVRNREVRRESVEVDRLLDDLLMLADTDARHHSVRIRIDMPEDLPAVQIDPVQVQQVILNLVRNGIDAMEGLPEHEREIVVSARRDAHGDVEIAVQDRGRGLTAEAAEELFKPFYTTKAGGTGLGLAISQSIVRAHGGKLWHAPDAQGGARFVFTLPLVSALTVES
jgi:two-component system sensor kinase FixL